MKPLYLQIYKFLQTIPKGRVVTYKTIADIFSIHPRYVGRILHSNTDLDRYPCYKVIKSDGKIGGYALGIEEKIRRLTQEGIVIEEGKIAQEYMWQKI